MEPAPADSKRILFLEPDDEVRARVSGMLATAGYEVRGVTSPGALVASLSDRPPDAAIVSLYPGGPDVSRAITALRGRGAGIPLLLLADARSARDAVRHLGQGTDDYLLRPPDPFELRTRLERILERHELDSRITFLQQQLSKKDGVRQLEASSHAMRRVLERVQRVAPMRSTVLISGESGVGKELVARLIHFSSTRRDQPFIPLNCAAIPTSLIESELFGHEKGAFTGAHVRARGKFEIAHRGTMFLDEIGDMDPATQAKLLRVLEQREFMRVGGDRSVRVNVRLIAATNADLEALVRQSKFRRDLYYRLKVVTITVPPLRERRADIPGLVERFLDELSRANAVSRKTMTPEVLAALEAYHWPGNVRELKNLIESALVSVPGEEIRAEDLPPAIRQSEDGRGAATLTPGVTLAELEREAIRLTLDYTGGNRTHSAAMLGIGVRTLQRKIRSLKLDIAPRRRRRRAKRGPSGRDS